MRLLITTALFLVLAGCDQTTGVNDRPDTSNYSHDLGKTDFPSGWVNDFHDNITLPDGRKVALYVVKRKGMVEQHYSPTRKAWSEPHLIYTTRTDPCQTVTLKAEHGTVAAIFGYATHCYDGEPPTESIAAVSTGHLQRWDTRTTLNIDGYNQMAFTNSGNTVRFSYNKDPATWHLGKGFNRRE